MKKLFTLVALLTCFMGAKAEVKKVVNYEIDYSTATSWAHGWLNEEEHIKFEDGCIHFHSDEAQEQFYSFQYQLHPGINPLDNDASYTITLRIKGTVEQSIHASFSGSGTPGMIPVTTDWVDVVLEGCVNDPSAAYFANSGSLLIQPGDYVGDIWISYIKITHEQDDGGVPQVWLQMLTDNGNPAAPEGDGKYVGDAEFGAWPAWSLVETDGINANWRGDRAGEICAWALTMGKNFDDQNTVIGEDSPRARPYPAPIEAEAGNETNHVFAVHVDQIAVIDAPTPDENSIAWSNQFWIQSPKGWKAGTKVHLKFRYKADHACSVATQIHKEHPSDYLHYEFIGDVSFSTEWQTFDKTLEITSSQGGGWSVAFNLCNDATNGRTPNVFYFDDLSWEVLKLEEGLFVAGKGKDFNYDYAQATQFEYSESDDAWVATVGTKGKQETWVDEVQISTVRGDKSAFLGATLKPTGNVKIVDGLSEWLDFTESSQAKIKVPSGVYKIYVALEDKQMQFEQLEGEAAKEPVDIVTYTGEIVIDAVERQPTSNEEEGGTGNTWDNQFFLYSSRDLAPGEETILEFDYKATKPSNSSVAYQGIVEGNPDYITGAFNMQDGEAFDTEWKSIKKELKMPDKKWDGKAVDAVKYITFDLACIKEANTYTFKNIKWYLKDDYNEGGKTMENLINADGEGNFAIKIGAGTDPIPMGIENVVFEKKTSNIIYNLAGQRVSKNYKGIVVKNGKKVVLK